MKCSECGKKIAGIKNFLTADIGSAVCEDCKRQETDIERRAESVLVTTTPTIEGYRIVAYLGIESVEIVIGTGFMSEFTGDVSDFFGKRSRGFERKLQKAKEAAFDDLKFRAANQGANAVVGIDLDYTEFSRNRIGLILNGTLVKVVPIVKGSP